MSKGIASFIIPDLSAGGPSCLRGLVLAGWHGHLKKFPGAPVQENLDSGLRSAACEADEDSLLKFGRLELAGRKSQRFCLFGRFVDQFSLFVRGRKRHRPTRYRQRLSLMRKA